MGVVDWLKKLFNPEPSAPAAKKARKRATPATANASRSASSRKPPAADTPARRTPTHGFSPHPPLPDDARWIRESEQVEFQGMTIHGGQFFIGSRLAAGLTGNEPSLIDPGLPVSPHDDSMPVDDLPYWPAYATISPRQRGVYLRWLATGRRDPGTPIGYPFLFLYGLERRVLVDRPAVQDAGEIPAIRTELVALRACYGTTNESFRHASGQLIDAIDLLEVDRAIASQANGPRHGHSAPPPLLPNNRTAPVSLQIGLGILALAHAPVPPDWALAWAWYGSDTTPRGAAIRCPDEFAALFTIRYRTRYGDGIVLHARRRPLAVTIRPTNATIGEQEIRAEHLPDGMAVSDSYHDLMPMIHTITNELDTYSRWLGRYRDRQGSLSAWAMLPEPLRTTTSPPAMAATTRLAALLGDASVAIIPGDALLQLWVGDRVTPPAKLTQPFGADLAQALGELGYGIEPDLRAGGAIAADVSLALFRDPDTRSGLTALENGAYAQAAILVDLAALVGEADGAATMPEFAAMRDYLRHTYALSPGEERRLGARLAWMASRPASDRTLAGMKKRIAPLSPEERDRLAIGLLRIADADGSVTPGEVTTLRKIWTVLGRDADRVASDLHAVMTEGRFDPTPPTRTARPPRAKATPARRARSDDDPVIVRQATPETPGVRIPRPPDALRAAPEPDLMLDPSSIARKIADTVAVSALLGDLLAEDSAQHSPASDVSRASDPVSPSQALLDALSGQETWSAEAFAILVDGQGMMPNAALDLLNELGFEHAGDPLMIEEADGSLSVDHNVLSIVREMTSPID